MCSKNSEHTFSPYTLGRCKSWIIRSEALQINPTEIMTCIFKMSPCKLLSCAFYRVSQKWGTKESKTTLTNFVFIISNICSTSLHLHSTHFLSCCILFLQILLNIFGSKHLLNIFPLLPDFLVTLAMLYLKSFIRYLFNFSFKGYICYAPSIAARTVLY